MSTQDLPDSHVRLVFAVMLHRAGLMTDEELRHEAVAAFGSETGALIAERVLAARSVTDPHPSVASRPSPQLRQGSPET